MARVHLPYRRDPERPSSVLKPLLDVMFFSLKSAEWILVKSMLADTGADYSMLPHRYGVRLVTDIESGQPIFVRGITTDVHTSPTAYLHYLTARLASDEFELPVAITLTDDTPPIFGRMDLLDRFAVTFRFGEKVIMASQWG